MSSYKKEIWGVYPPPIGGVSMHVKRLVLSINKIGYVCLKDFKPKRNYSEYFIEPVFNPIKEVISLLFVKKKIIHNQQFSIFVFICLLIFGCRHKIGMTIHNQRSLNINNAIKMWICKLFFRKCSFIIMNDEAFSYKFSEKFGVPLPKIHIQPAFIKQDASERKGLPLEIMEFRNKHDLLLSANAFKLRRENEIDVYGLDMLVKLIAQLHKNNINAGLLFCLPIIGDESYFKEIKIRIFDLNLSNHIVFVIGENENGFEYWGISDVFIRPTLTDMEGISIKEALLEGTHVIASDVCARPQECVLFKSRDQDDLYNKVSEIYLSGKYKDRVEYKNFIDVAQATWRIYQNII